MAWEVFKPGRATGGSPLVTISSLGRMMFNRASTETLEKAGFSKVDLLWDETTHRIGVRPATNGVIPLKFHAARTSPTFSCSSFLNHIHYDWSSTRNFPATWDTKEKMLVFEVPEAHLGAAPLNRRKRLKRGQTPAEGDPA